MSGIGSSEFILLLVIGLIVLGPKRLPEVANKIGGWIGQARRMTRVMKRQLEDELNFDEHRNILPPTPPFAEQSSQADKPTETSAEGDPEFVAAAESAEAPEDAGADEVADETPDHIPNDDDTYSPLHAAGDGEDDEPGAKKQGA